MERFKRAAKEIIEHVKIVMESIKKEEVEKFIEEIIKAKRIFLYGAGRSGLVAKSFGMRLTHLAKETFIIGETITPAVRKDDIVIFVSGSGRTLSVITTAKAAKKLGAKILAITSNKNSELYKLSDVVVVIRGKTKDDIRKDSDYIANQLKGMHEPLTPLGTLFEDSCQIFFDSLVVELMRRMRKNEKEMINEHANIE